MFKVDLHTHSVASPDGGLSVENYRQALDSERLQVIAITDHNRVDFAENLRGDLGDSIIIGEEITTVEGEIIGLYLQEKIPENLTALEAVQQIHNQGGIVYVPHPFETTRKGLAVGVLDQLEPYIDIIETYNGRTLQNRSAKANHWASEHCKAKASSSDAHGRVGWGNTWSTLTAFPNRETLVQLLADSAHHAGSTGVIGRAYPKFNRLHKRGRYA